MKNKRKGQNTFPKTNEAMRAYQSVADPLGSYTGITDDLRAMPRKRIDGKVYMRLEDIPQQDADDL